MSCWGCIVFFSLEKVATHSLIRFEFFLFFSKIWETKIAAVFSFEKFVSHSLAKKVDIRRKKRKKWKLSIFLSFGIVFFQNLWKRFFYWKVYISFTPTFSNSGKKKQRKKTPFWKFKLYRANKKYDTFG